MRGAIRQLISQAYRLNFSLRKLLILFYGGERGGVPQQSISKHMRYDEQLVPLRVKYKNREDAKEATRILRKSNKELKKNAKKIYSEIVQKEKQAKKVKHRGSVPQKRRFVDYFSYIQSIKWWRKAKGVKERRKFCESCGTTTQLTVHHLTYIRLGKEKDEDLALLCWPCHEQQHPDKMLEDRIRQIAKYG